ncbi:hypothetical protein IWQ62_005406 [Dispira parvispora]|uniref:G protein-coupled receptor n=1 Tax=Dispira parvispora TaxID=1520584 RepID=A0A9W8AIW0_9FUNG|nr:hypothetical protein IWQ62_005406 [Dispira parvispora]
MNYLNDFPQSPAYVRFFTWLNFFSSFWFIYSTCMITLDLHLIFFHRLPRQARIRRWYPLIGFSIALLLSIPYLCLSDATINTEGVMMMGYSGSDTTRFFIAWDIVFLFIGNVYSIIVVIAVCIKMFVARSQLRRFSQDRLNNTSSRSLFRNARLIIAYPMVLIIVYVPYVIGSWMYMKAYGDTFTQYWQTVAGYLFSFQGIFSFAIVLFHPIMLATYRERNIELSSMWSRLSRRFWSSPNDKQSDSSTLLFSQFLTTENVSTDKPVADILTCPPQVKTMDMGPGVTGFFNDALGNDGTLSSTAGKYPHEIQGVTVLRMGDCTVNESALEPRNLFIEATTL